MTPSTHEEASIRVASVVCAALLMLLPARFLVPGGELVIPAMVVLTLVAVIGVRYLRGLRRAAA